MGVNRQLHWNYYVNNNGRGVWWMAERFELPHIPNLFDLLFMHLDKRPRPPAALIPVYIFHTRVSTKMNK